MNTTENTKTFPCFIVDVLSDTVNLLLDKEATLLRDLPKDSITCATGDYSDIVVIPNPSTFLSVKDHLPALDSGEEWFCSPTCMLLTQSPSGDMSIKYGLLAKWVDDDQLFWYEDDVIENVVGWMPYPKQCPSESKADLINALIAHHDHNKDVYWSLDLLSENNILAPDCFMSATFGIPPLHITTETTIESDVYLVEYEYGTANGVYTGLSTAKLVFDKATGSIKWDNSKFYAQHSFTRDVINWKKLPPDVIQKFQI